MSKNTKNGKANRYVVLAIIVIAAIILDIAAISGMKRDIANENIVEVGAKQNVTWAKDQIGGDTVSINLIKKINDNPNTYVLVRKIADRTSNDGSATWVPAISDVGDRLSLEVGCTVSKNACVAIDDFSSDLAVVESDRFANTAASYEAIEAMENI